MHDKGRFSAYNTKLLSSTNYKMLYNKPIRKGNEYTRQIFQEFLMLIPCRFFLVKGTSTNSLNFSLDCLKLFEKSLCFPCFEKVGYSTASFSFNWETVVKRSQLYFSVYISALVVRSAAETSCGLTQRTNNSALRVMGINSKICHSLSPFEE